MKFHLSPDLKPDNVLCTEFMTCKLSDFGTSRFWSEEGSGNGNFDATMTAVGTPMFCAPEISRGEHYDEKVDVYSFGVLLQCMAVEEDITSFVGERWRRHFKKKKVPNTCSIAFNRVLKPIWDGEWKPVTAATPIPQAPPFINALIDKCTSFSPELRPSFAEILITLAGPCHEEIFNSAVAYTRKKPEEHATATNATDGAAAAAATTAGGANTNDNALKRPDMGRSGMTGDMVPPQLRSGFAPALSDVEEGSESMESSGPSFSYSNPILGWEDIEK
jgi:serine/threonine protein kinase